MNTGTALFSTIQAVADHYAAPRWCGIVHGDADTAAVTRALDDHDLPILMNSWVTGIEGNKVQVGDYWFLR